MKKLVILFIFVTIFINVAYGQSIDLILSPRLEMAHVVYMSDFAFIEKQSLEAFESEFMFQVSFYNFTGTEEGTLVFEIRRGAQGGQVLGRAESNPFVMPEGDHFFNNMQLNEGVRIGDTEVRFDTRTIDWPDDDFQNEVLGSNKLPRDQYIFRISFAGITGEQAIDVFNPTYIVPVTPGYPANRDASEIIFTDMPTFIFDSDLNDPIALMENPFKIQVYQKLDQHASLDEITTGQPHLEAVINTAANPTMTVNYTEFPEAEPLKPGTYVWRVQMTTQTSGGQETTPSPLYSFTVRDLNNQGVPEDEAATEDIYELLKNIVGTDRARAIAQELSGYHLNAIRINGAEITVNDLYDIIDNYQGHLVEITDIVLQSTQN
jgi:hypothetical protein